MSGAFIANTIKKTLNDEDYPKQFFFTFPALIVGKPK